MSAPGTLSRVRIPYIVRGETRPQSWIIMIYGLTKREREGEKKRKSLRERGREKQIEEKSI